MKLIGLCGQQQTGKSTVAKMIENVYPNAVAFVSFAAKIKEICADLFDWPIAKFEDGVWKETEDKRYPMPDGEDYPAKHYLTPRIAMRLIGTEGGRACYSNVWADRGMREVGRLRASGYWHVVVITDVRFPREEAPAIRKDGGAIWRIWRGAPREESHASESQIYGAEMGRYVTTELYNDGTLEQLQTTVAKLLKGI
jgi:hypothetical protein